MNQNKTTKTYEISKAAAVNNSAVLVLPSLRIQLQDEIMNLSDAQAAYVLQRLKKEFAESK